MKSSGLFFLLFLLLAKVSHGYVLPSTSRATKLLMDLKRDFDMNFGFQLRKMGIVQSIKRSSKLSSTSSCPRIPGVIFFDGCRVDSVELIISIGKCNTHLKKICP